MANIMNTKRDLYEILNITQSASQVQIKQAFYRLARKWHPDKNNSKQALGKFQDLNEAYKTLSDRDKRAYYDLFDYPTKRKSFKSKIEELPKKRDPLFDFPRNSEQDKDVFAKIDGLINQFKRHKSGFEEPSKFHKEFCETDVYCRRNN